jgi:hypothetical protein
MRYPCLASENDGVPSSAVSARAGLRSGTGEVSPGFARVWLASGFGHLSNRQRRDFGVTH